MKKQSIVTIGILLYLSLVLFSCKSTEKIKYKYNGIYKTQINGKALISINSHSIGEKLLIDTIPLITPMDFSFVKMNFHYINDEPQLFIKLTENGKLKFAEVTKNNIEQPLALILNDKLLQISTIHGEISNGNIEVLGIDKKLIEELIKYFEK